MWTVAEPRPPCAAPWRAGGRCSSQSANAALALPPPGDGIELRAAAVAQRPAVCEPTVVRQCSERQKWRGWRRMAAGLPAHARANSCRKVSGIGRAPRGGAAHLTGRTSVDALEQQPARVEPIARARDRARGLGAVCRGGMAQVPRQETGQFWSTESAPLPTRASPCDGDSTSPVSSLANRRQSLDAS